MSGPGARASRGAGGTGIRLGLALFTAVLLPFLAYAFLSPATYRAAATLTVTPELGSPLTAPSAAASLMRQAILEPGRGMATLETVDGRDFVLTVEDRDAVRAHWYANALATRAAKEAPSLLDSNAATRRELEKTSEARATELARFLTTHSELARPEGTARDPAREAAASRAFAKLEEERAFIKGELAGPVYPESDASEANRTRLERRLLEIESTFTSLNRQRKAHGSVQPAMLADLQRLLEGVAQARATRQAIAGSERRIGVRVVEATLPVQPVRPDRQWLSMLGLASAAFTFFLTVAVARWRRASAFAAELALEEGLESPFPPRAEPPRQQSSWPPAAAPAPERPQSSWPPPTAPAPERPQSSWPPPTAPAPERPQSSWPPPTAPAPERPQSSWPPPTAPAPERAPSSWPPAAAPIATRASSSRPPMSSHERRPASEPAVSALVMAHRVPAGWAPDPTLRPQDRRSWAAEILPLVGDRGFVVGVSSANDAMVKGRFASELALALSETKKVRVLLLESDFHEPTLHHLLRVDMPPFAGFSEQLKGRLDRASNPHWYVIHCSDFLHLLAEGATHLPELILSRHFEESINEFREYYDVIVLDAPSLVYPVDCRAVSDVLNAVAVAPPSQGIDRAGVEELFVGRTIHWLEDGA